MEQKENATQPLSQKTKNRLRLIGFTYLISGLVLFGAMLFSIAQGEGTVVPVKMEDTGSIAFTGLTIAAIGIPFLTWRTKWFDAFIGLLMTFVMIIALEIGFRALSPPSTSIVAVRTEENQIVETEGELSHIPHPYIGYTYAPNSKRTRTTMQENADGTLDVLTTTSEQTDQYGRRLVPIENLENRPYHLIFFGGSFTAGYALDDQDSLPTQLGQQLPQYAPYNYGVGGYGTQNMLAQLESTDLTSQVSQPKGVALYIFIAPHVQRVIGRSNIFWRDSLPYYQLDHNGRPQHQGSMLTTGRPFYSLVQNIINHSQIAKSFQVSLPLQKTETHYQLTAQIIAQAKAEYQAQFGANNQFIVVIYPRQGAPELIPYLEAAEIDYLDYHDLDPYIDASRYEYWFQDGHPQAVTHKGVAEQLARHLR